MAACTLCVNRPYVCSTFSTHFLCCSHLFNAKTNRVHMWCVYIPCSRVGYIMRVGLLGSKVIKKVLLNETLR